MPGAVENIIDALRGEAFTVLKTGERAMAQCPAHPDNNPSLSIGPRKDGRGAVIHCHAGCHYTDVLAALNLTESDLYDDSGIVAALKDTATYAYAGGRKNHRGVKDGKKTFWQECSEDKSLFAVETIGDAKVVYLCEGEKGAMMLRALGYAAVATGGAQRTCDLEPLRGRIVIVIADRDKSGQEWAHRNAQALSGVAMTISMVQSKADVDKADIVEHISAGYDVTELEPVTVSEAKPETNGHKSGRHIEWLRGTEIKTAVPIWAWHYKGKGRIQLGTLALLAGRPGAGKSTAARWFATQASLGQLDGQWEGDPQQVAYIAAEESLKYTIVPGLRAAGANMSNIHFPAAYHDGEPTQILSTIDEIMLTDYMIEKEITIVIIDPLMSTVTSRTDINRNNEVRGQIAPWARIAETISGISLGVVHLRKNSSGGDVVAAINGSSAFGEVARSIFAFAKMPDNDETRIMSQHKNSTGSEDLSLTYEIASRTLYTDDDKMADVGVFNVIGDSDLTVEDIMAEGMQIVGPGTECKNWLEDYLSAEGPAPSQEVKREASKVGGWAHATVERAAKKLKIVVTSKGFPRMTYWSVAIQQSPLQSPNKIAEVTEVTEDE